MTRPRGSLLAFAVAFALMAAAGVCVVIAGVGTLENLGLLRVAWFLSGAAIVAAIASVLIPGRGPR